MKPKRIFSLETLEKHGKCKTVGGQRVILKWIKDDHLYCSVCGENGDPLEAIYNMSGVLEHSKDLVVNAFNKDGWEGSGMWDLTTEELDKEPPASEKDTIDIDTALSALRDMMSQKLAEKDAEIERLKERIKLDTKTLEMFTYMDDIIELALNSHKGKYRYMGASYITFDTRKQVMRKSTASDYNDSDCLTVDMQFFINIMKAFHETNRDKPINQIFEEILNIIKL